MLSDLFVQMQSELCSSDANMFAGKIYCCAYVEGCDISHFCFVQAVFLSLWFGLEKCNKSHLQTIDVTFISRDLQLTEGKHRIPRPIKHQRLSS